MQYEPRYKALTGSSGVPEIENEKGVQQDGIATKEYIDRVAKNAAHNKAMLATAILLNDREAIKDIIFESVQIYNGESIPDTGSGFERMQVIAGEMWKIHEERKKELEKE